jgi:hypothetical protein
MKAKRDFGRLVAHGNAAAANVGSLESSVNKDKLLYLDPVNDIVYLPENNTRSEEVVEYEKAELIEFRLEMDAVGQLQEVVLYPLPPELCKKLNKKPGTYGIAFGHLRVLSSRLTSKDDPRIGPTPRKVMARVDDQWLNKKSSERLLSQIQENSRRRPLNFVEEGMAIRRLRDELSEELGRKVSQRELLEYLPGKTEKTLGYLMQAADFNPLVKTACHRKMLTDLDSLVTFDGIAKLREDVAEQIFITLEDPQAPRLRSIFRTVKMKLEQEPGFAFDVESWDWPAMFEEQKASTSAPATASPGAGTPEVPVTTQTRQGVAGAGEGTGQAGVADAAGVHELEFKTPATDSSEAGGTKAPSESATDTGAGVNTTAKSGEPKAAAEADKHVLPVIMVRFKMAIEAKTTFTGQLLLDQVPKSASLGTVAYLEKGIEKTIDVPLKLIEIVSIAR